MTILFVKLVFSIFDIHGGRFDRPSSEIQPGRMSMACMSMIACQ